MKIVETSLILEAIREAGREDLSVLCHYPLNELIKEPCYLNDEECKYAMNKTTHLDFLIYSMISKRPIVAIEVDGFHYHKEGTEQAKRDKKEEVYSGTLWNSADAICNERKWGERENYRGTKKAVDSKSHWVLDTINLHQMMRNIGLYKLLWHIQVFGLKGDRYSKFSDLVLEHYYTDFVLSPEEYIKRFFDELMVDGDNGKMIIAKESDGERATLKELFELYADGGRGALQKAFDGSQIADNHKKKGSIHFYMNQEINTIVFITDNIMSGHSTKDMLDFYLRNQRNPGDKRTYLWKHSYIVPSILQDSRAKIELKCIFALEKGKNYIEQEFLAENVKVSPLQLIPDDRYNWTDEVEDIINELYEPEEARTPNPTISVFFGLVICRPRGYYHLM